MINSFITYLYRRFFTPNIYKRVQQLRVFDITNPEQKKNHQLKKLEEVLKIAINKVPFYKKMNLPIHIKDISYEDFRKIPIITKELIRDNSSELLNGNYKKLTYKNTSGGSTGEPLEFYQTKEQGVYGTLNYYYALQLNGIRGFEKSVDLWGAERDMHKIKKKFNFKSLIYNKTSLNTFILSETIIEHYVKILNKKKPVFIKAYVHSIYEIAKYINSKSVKINFKPVIHCTTGPLYPEMRNEISKAFNQAYVYNFYGSREVSAIATEVKGLEGMYVLFDNVFVEILDSDNNPVQHGEEGEIVITTLNNHYMPLIRYKIGDRAIKGDDSNYGVLLMKKVVGRTLGVIHREDGSQLDGQFFTSLFFNKKGIKSFQLVQKSIYVLVLYVVKNKNFNSNELEEVILRIKDELPNVTIQLLFVDKINLTSTGKIMYVYSEI
ncbi:phenylacetate--CoA ligase family protein [Arenibacter certesii]|uniref:Adenylyltransferase n=1 Tax=Arenibacter certesii TaxID=228955 RepID=A0A918IMW4_9FLAO|nr:phenylacetate--CoA ligase family protein [Arenibacter certesii]GGW22055.1 adenylyltransferase [Arenibacter certesii]